MGEYKIKMGISSLAGGKLLLVEYDKSNARVDGDTTPTLIDYVLNGDMITSRGVTKRIRSFNVICRRAEDPDGYGTLDFVRGLFHSSDNKFYYQDVDGATEFMVGILNLGDFLPKPRDARFLGASSLWEVKLDLREQ